MRQTVRTRGIQRRRRRYGTRLRLQVFGNLGQDGPECREALHRPGQNAAVEQGGRRPWRSSSPSPNKTTKAARAILQVCYPVGVFSSSRLFLPLPRRYRDLTLILFSITFCVLMIPFRFPFVHLSHPYCYAERFVGFSLYSPSL